MGIQFSLRNKGWTCKNNPHLCQKTDKVQAKTLLRGGDYVRNTFNWDKSEKNEFLVSD